jgi:outer membrane protein assembly factor BamB
MVAIDLRSGERAWEQEIGGIYQPWVVGDFVYVLSTEGNLFCLTRNDGRVRWVNQLPKFENLAKKSGPIRWVGPVLAGGRLLVLSSTAKAQFLSVTDGKPIGDTFSLPGPAFLPPIVVGDGLYILTDDADLIAMR